MTSSRWGLWIALAVVLLIRLPFLNQAIQGDDHIYLTEAEHALIDPLHPSDVKYVFLGDEVDLRGHSHPPGNAWPLAGLILLFGDVKEIPFHAAYIVFSLIAVWAMWSVASRFSERPLWATLLFIAVPPFVINGGSLEADLPFLAFWMAAVALFFSGRLALAALAMAATAMMAYQAVFLIPVLGAYCWIYHRRDRARWMTLATPLLVLVGWQLFTRLTTGTMPAGKLAEYFDHYGLQAIEHKLKSAVMLVIHTCWIVFPTLVPGAVVLAWRKRREPDTLFLLAWIGLFLAGAMLLFFAGSARYLLPMAAPVCILASRLQTKWLAPAFALQLALALALAAVNYQHWDGYRAFAAAFRAPSDGRRVWVDNDWGLRYYLEADHGLPARKGQPVRPDDLIVSSELGHNVAFNAPLTLLTSETIQSAIPLRLIGLNSHSGYSTVEEGFLPFGISSGPIDRVLARVVKERRVAEEYLTIHSPAAAEQIVGGIDASDGWMTKSASVVLKSPAAPRKLRAEFYIPPNAKAREVTLLLDGREVAKRTYPGPGPYTLETAEPLQGMSAEIRVDQTFTAPGDKRALGMVLTGIGFARE
uniref:Glycosyltransferase RgtA/B/C/D-like domain-containing protein n=1 Tax=Solibacter usitatus (strain Ellin6076) TaxID=234267 RepID=Q02BS6_SOLUE